MGDGLHHLKSNDADGSREWAWVCLFSQAVEEAEKAAKAKKTREQDEAKQGNYEKRKSLVESFGGSTTLSTLGDHACWWTVLLINNSSRHLNILVPLE